MVVLLSEDLININIVNRNTHQPTVSQVHSFLVVVVVAVIPLKALVLKPSLLHCSRCTDRPLRHWGAQTCEVLTFPTVVRPVLAGLYYTRLRPSTQAPGALMASEEPRRR